MGDGSVDSGCHEVSENVWFVWLENHKVEKGSGQVGGRGIPSAGR